jgi:hypothetical protein
MSPVVQVLCMGTDVLMLVIIVLGMLAPFLERRARTHDPLRYLHGKLQKGIGGILRTPVYDPSSQARPLSRTKPGPTDEMP